ncbi:hypothetical protein [Coleofasciculus sp. FACHB-SPT9]|nr:hypothetical protein [Coleofasciculus sp. FACHB-SPT9]MBD1890180.1 hypothetical protein [Coleofasciculus sp. FACHB-SPT9]
MTLSDFTFGATDDRETDGGSHGKDDSVPTKKVHENSPDELMGTSTLFP